MPDVPPDRPPLSDRSGVTDAVRVQILATEHWGLLATRSMVWNEIFTRAGMFLTVLSASVVGLALVADATDFGRGFQLFAFLVLPVVLFLGWATYTRINAASGEDIYAVVGMNRLRHAYLELAPELEPYFVTGHHDDISGVLQSMALAQPSRQVSPSAVLASTPLLVAIISAVVAGVLAGLAADALGAPSAVFVAVGIATGLAYAVAMFASHLQGAMRLAREAKPRFPDMDRAEV